jgi:hypothetical protein
MVRKNPVPFKPTGSFYYFKRAIDIIKLNRQAMEEIASDNNALRFGLAVTAIGGSLSVVSQADLQGLLVFALFAVGALFLFAGFVHLLAGYSKGKEEYMGFVRITALTGILDWLAIVPPTAIFVTIWSVVVAIVATQQIYNITKGKAVLFVLLSVFALWTMAFVLLTGPLSFYYTPR